MLNAFANEYTCVYFNHGFKDDVHTMRRHRRDMLRLLR
jgi:hypothetical protein